MRRILVPGLLALAALAANGCGDDAPTGPEPPAGALRYTQIDVGYFHACALAVSGNAYCWGGNTTGALGDGTSEPSARPRPVAGGHEFLAIDAGAAHTCAVDDAGLGWCWGHNDEGQLGDGGFSPHALPTRVDLDLPLRAISAGHAHTCALTRTTREVWCWGDDSAGQIGDGPPDGAARKPTPVRGALPPAEYVAVHAGYYQTCALDAFLEAYCWGLGSSGQIGDGSDSTRHVPTPVALAGSAQGIAPGDRFVCAIVEHDVLCWGANRHGELAATAGANRLLPAEASVTDVDAIATSIGASTIGGSQAYACAIPDDGRARCWGGAVPALREQDATPTLLDDALRFESLALGPQFVCALSRAGYAYCGGANAAGELGVGDDDDRARMTPVVAP